MSDSRQKIAPPAAGAPPGGDRGAGAGLTYRDLQRAIFLVAGLFLFYQLAAPLAALLLLFLLSFILAAALNPVAVWLRRWGVPRIVSAIGLVALSIGLLGVVAWLLLPPLIDQVSGLIGQFHVGQLKLGKLYERLLARFPAVAPLLPPPEELYRHFSPNLTALVGKLGSYVVSLGTTLLSGVLLLVLVVWTLSRPEPLVAGLLTLLPENKRERAGAALQRCMEQLQSWAASSLLLGGIIGVLSAAGLWLLGRITGQPLPFILLFGLVAAVGELIPNIGPVLSAVPPLLFALTIDPMLALWVAILYFALQQLENHLVVPLVMGRSLRLHPVSLIFTLLVMTTLFGIIGALLAVPVATILKVCWEELYLKPRGINSEQIEERAAAIIQNHAFRGRTRTRAR